MNIKLGDPVRAGENLFEVHAEADGELAYSLDYLKENTDVVEIK